MAKKDGENNFGVKNEEMPNADKVVKNQSRNKMAKTDGNSPILAKSKEKVMVSQADVSFVDARAVRFLEVITKLKCYQKLSQITAMENGQTKM